jgi:hypothetical protein
MSDAGRLFASKKLDAMISDVMREKYGSKSFMRYYVKGAVCTSNCTVCHPFFLFLFFY